MFLLLGFLFLVVFMMALTSNVRSATKGVNGLTHLIKTRVEPWLQDMESRRTKQ